MGRPVVRLHPTRQQPQPQLYKDNTNGDVILAELECVPSVVKYKVNTENSTRPRPNKRKAEEEQEPPGCRSLQTEETGPDRDPPGGGQQLGEEEQEPGGGGGRPEGRQGGAAVHPGRSQEHLLAPGEGGAGHWGGISCLCGGSA